MERELLESVLESRNVTVSGRRTSMRLEPDMWDALAEICRREGMTMNQLCSRIDEMRRGGSLTSATRVYVMRYFRRRAADADSDAAPDAAPDSGAEGDGPAGGRGDGTRPNLQSPV